MPGRPPDIFIDKRAVTEGQEIPELEDAGQERGHVPSAVPARLRVPVRTGWAATGGCPYTGDPMGSPDTATLCPRFCSPEGATWNSPGQVTRNAPPPSVHSVHSVHHKIKNAGETPALQEETCRAGEISGDAVILIRCGVVIAVWG